MVDCRGTTGQAAAGELHSEIQRGYRAEIVAYERLMARGSMDAAGNMVKSAWRARVQVRDGDILTSVAIVTMAREPDRLNRAAAAGPPLEPGNIRRTS